jgi:hypothetical protein
VSHSKVLIENHILKFTSQAQATSQATTHATTARHNMDVAMNEVEADGHGDGDNQEAEAMEIVGGGEGGEAEAAEAAEVAVEIEIEAVEAAEAAEEQEDLEIEEAEAGALQVVDTQMVRARDSFSPPSLLLPLVCYKTTTGSSNTALHVR